MRAISLGAASAAYPVFEKMGWKYWDDPKPNINRLAKIIDHLIDKAEDNWEDGYEISTGRFCVKIEEEEIKILLELT